MISYHITTGENGITSIAVSIKHSYWILLHLVFPPYIYIYIYIYIYRDIYRLISFDCMVNKIISHWTKLSQIIFRCSGIVGIPPQDGKV